MTTFNAHSSDSSLVGLDALALWSELRPRIEERFQRINRRYVTAREFHFLLQELIDSNIARHGLGGSHWMFGVFCQAHLRRLLAMQDCAIGRRDIPKARNKAGSFAGLERKAIRIAASTAQLRQ